MLNELFSERLIPFPLRVGKITKGSGEYTIHFYDSRMRTAVVPLLKTSSFRDMVRAAVLKRVRKLSGPLKDWHKKGSTK